MDLPGPWTPARWVWEVISRGEGMGVTQSPIRSGGNYQPNNNSDPGKGSFVHFPGGLGHLERQPEKASHGEE